jgi:hypothetical protein
MNKFKVGDIIEDTTTYDNETVPRYAQVTLEYNGDDEHELQFAWYRELANAIKHTYDSTPLEFTTEDHESTYIHDFKIVKFIQSPLWKLMNEVE